MELRGKSILLTGASSGIGRATAVVLARKGAKMVLGGRHAEALEDTRRQVSAAGGEAVAVAGDVTDAQWRGRAVDQAVNAYGRLNVLINNAGVVAAGRLERMSAEDLEQQLLTNLVAPILLTRHALPALRQSGDGAVVNVSSTIGLVGMPFYAFYGASKAGIARFGEALRRELDGEGVRVLTVYTAATDTPMMETAELGPEHGFQYETPEQVANALVAGLEADEIEVIRGDDSMRSMIQGNQRTPRAIDEQLLPVKSTLEQATAHHRRL